MTPQNIVFKPIFTRVLHACAHFSRHSLWRRTKILNVTAFADAYMSYDVVARKFRAYGFIYPFIELALGAAYLVNFQPFAINLVTLIVMGVSSIGVIQSLLNKRKIRCACLGTVFNLPMSVITLVEDGLMVAMAAAMLLMGGGHGGY